jgi:hypothetical protein
VIFSKTAVIRNLLGYAFFVVSFLAAKATFFALANFAAGKAKPTPTRDPRKWVVAKDLSQHVVRNLMPRYSTYFWIGISATYFAPVLFDQLNLWG